jgi:multidrug transporter EmrE-like cation transporter
MRGYLYLFISILSEITGATFLKLSEGFTNLIPSLLLVFFYGLAFIFIIFALKTVSLSVGYSIWAGLGTAGASLVGMFLFEEMLSGINIIGLIVIISGVVIMNMNRKSESA